MQTRTSIYHLNRSIHNLALLGIVLMLLVGSQAPEVVRAANPSPVGTPEQLINPDGTIALGTRFTGALDVRGYSVTLDPHRGPVLAPLAAAVAGNWEALLPDPGFGTYGTQVDAVAISGTDVYVGGSFSGTGIGNYNAYDLAKWNGSTWSPVGSVHFTGNVDTIVVDGTDLYVGGSFTNLGGDANADYIAKFNGSTWSALGTVPLNNEVRAIAVDGTDIYAGGYFTDAGGDTNADYVAKWNGSAWSALGTTPILGPTSVWTIAVQGTDVYVGGGFHDAGGVAAADFIAKWNGAAWSSLGTLPLNNVVTSMAFSATGDLYAGGWFTDAGGNTNADYIARWSSGRWSPLGTTPLNDRVWSVAVSGTRVYAAGRFTWARGDPNANYVALWNGSAWSSLGSTPLSSYAYAVAVSNAGELYAGGVFKDAGGAPAADMIARFVETKTPVFSVTPTSANYGIVKVGKVSPARMFTIKNTGTGNLTITSALTLGGTNPGQFAITARTCTFGLVLVPNATCTVTAAFKPTSAGLKSGYISVPDNAAGHPHHIPLTGKGGLEVSVNGGFNSYPSSTARIPTSWNAVNFASTDGKNTLYKYEGTASVKIANTSARSKTLTQTRVAAGAASDTFLLSAWAKGASIPTTSGLVQVKVMLYNGTTLVLTKTLVFPAGTYPFTRKSLSFAAGHAYTAIRITVLYSKATGGAWFDGLSLLRSP